MKHVANAKNRIMSLAIWQKIGLILLLVAAGWFGYTKLKPTATKPQYQTATAEKGTLVVSITSSGNVSTANNASVSTQASGVVNKVYVQNGQTVKVGDPIATIDLDLDGKQRSTQAYASYQSASNALNTAKANLYTSQSTLYSNWQKYMDLAQNTTYQNPDGSANTSNRTLTPFTTAQDNWLAAEAQYNNQLNAINQAQTALSSAWSSYQQSSPTIYAPISGTVTGLSLQVGSVISAQTSTSGTATSQKIASIKTDAPPTVTVSLTEIDIPKVAIGNKATLTFDAFPNKTFTGKIVSVDTVGSVSSGVTSYPTIIKLDDAVDGILTNMSATANIIVKTKNDVVLVPSAAVQTQNGTSTVRILKNGNVTSVPVEIGDANDSETEIVTGVSEGDTVVTSSVSSTTSTRTSSGTSIFSAMGRGGFGR